MTRSPATRIQRVQPPATLAAGEKARQLARQGHDIVDLGQSSPHHVTPQHIIDAGIEALNAGLTNISSSPRAARTAPRHVREARNSQWPHR